MEEITAWFQEKDYDTGVQLYSQLPKAKPRILIALKRGKSDRNMATLCRELRTAKKTVKKAPRPARHPKPETRNPQPVTRISEPGARIPEPSVQVELERKQAVEKSASGYFQKIRYGELPAELRLRFKKAKDLFYQMSDLKFALNSLPASAEQEALELQLLMESLDEQRATIWKELEHWQTYKTMLPTKATEDFSQLSPQKLFLKKANIQSSISKMKKRIEKNEAEMEQETDKAKKLKLSQQINRSQKKLHQHEINLRKIEELL